jgi:hypothetical protein
MKRLCIALLLLSPALSRADSILCPAVDSIGGTYQTDVDVGYEPNRLQILAPSQSSKAWTLALTSRWAPRPHDNGDKGAVGEFEGELRVPNPWSCVAIFSVEEKSKDDADSFGPVCHLVLRFVGLDRIFVEQLGRCDYFHGHLAIPAGIYKKVNAA